MNSHYSRKKSSAEYQVFDAIPSLAERKRYYMQRIKELFRTLFSIEPIIINFIALTICGVILFILSDKELIPNIGKYYFYFYNSIQLLACLQVIRSAKYSLIIPLLMILIAGIGLGTHIMPELSPLSTFKEMMLVGLIGLATAVFYIR